MPARILDVKGRQNVFKWYFDHGLSVSNIALKLNGCATDGAPLAGEDFISKRSLRRLVLQFCKNGDWSMDKRLRTFKQVPEAVLSALRQVVDERPSGYTCFFFRKCILLSRAHVCNHIACIFHRVVSLFLCFHMCRYLDEFHDRLNEYHGINMSVSAICRTIHAKAPHSLGFSRLVMERAAVQKSYAERRIFQELVQGYDPRRLVFFDEVHKGRNESSRRRCYAPRGIAYTQQERFNPTTFSMTVAFTHRGFVPMSEFINTENMDSSTHLLWVDGMLAPQLGKMKEPVVLYDNVSFHWDDDCLARLRQISDITLLPLPAYSPEVHTSQFYTDFLYYLVFADSTLF